MAKPAQQEEEKQVNGFKQTKLNNFRTMMLSEEKEEMQIHSKVSQQKDVMGKDFFNKLRDTTGNQAASKIKQLAG